MVVNSDITNTNTDVSGQGGAIALPFAPMLHKIECLTVFKTWTLSLHANNRRTLTAIALKPLPDTKDTHE